MPGAFLRTHLKNEGADVRGGSDFRSDPCEKAVKSEPPFTWAPTKRIFKTRSKKWRVIMTGILFCQPARLPSRRILLQHELGAFPRCRPGRGVLRRWSLQAA